MASDQPAEDTPMAMNMRRGRCGRVFVTLQGSFDAEAAERLHDLLAAAEPAPSVVIDFQAIHFVEPLALLGLAGEAHVRGRSLTVMGLSPRNQRLLTDLARRPRN